LNVYLLGSTYLLGSIYNKQVTYLLGGGYNNGSTSIRPISTAVRLLMSKVIKVTVT